MSKHRYLMTATGAGCGAAQESSVSWNQAATNLRHCAGKFHTMFSQAMIKRKKDASSRANRWVSLNRFEKSSTCSTLWPETKYLGSSSDTNHKHPIQLPFRNLLSWPIANYRSLTNVVYLSIVSSTPWSSRKTFPIFNYNPTIIILICCTLQYSKSHLASERLVKTLRNSASIIWSSNTGPVYISQHFVDRTVEVAQGLKRVSWILRLLQPEIACWWSRYRCNEYTSWRSKFICF